MKRNHMRLSYLSIQMRESVLISKPDSLPDDDSHVILLKRRKHLHNMRLLNYDEFLS
jgi:hypothetical protein